MQSVGVVRCGRAWACTGVRQCGTLIARAREKLGELGEGEVTLEKDNSSGVATLTLRNEKRKNALSGRMMVQLANHTHSLQSWAEGKAVILRSQGDTFCSGSDLTSMLSLDLKSDGILFSTLMHDTLTRLHTLPLLTATLVHGGAIGGGAELITSTDFRVFTNSGSVRFVQARMGVVPGWGGGNRLIRLIGVKRTLDLLTTCRKINYETALNIGLADLVVPDSEMDLRLREWIGERISHPAEVIQGIKRITTAGRDLGVREGLDEEKKVFVELFAGPVSQNAFGSLRNKK